HHHQVRPGHAGRVLQQQQHDQQRQTRAVGAQQRAEQGPAGGAQPDRRLLVRCLGLGPLGVIVRGDPAPLFDIDRHGYADTSSSAAADNTPRYAGTVASNREWVPTAAMTPSTSRATRSASATVLGLCTTRIAVVPCSTRASASSTRDSVCTSSADSGSSSTSS